MNAPGFHHTTLHPFSQKADALYRLLMQAPVAMVVVNRDAYTIELANASQLQGWGRQGEEVVGQPLLEVFTGARSWVAHLEDVMQSGEPCTVPEQAVTSVRHGVPQTTWLDLAFEPLPGEQGIIDRVLVVSTDVTRQVVERRKAEELGHTLYSLTNALPQLVWIAGPDGSVSYYNDQVAQFAGAERLPDGSWHWEGMLHPDDQQPTAAAWQRAVASGAVYQKEHRVRMKDGTWRWHLSRGFPHRDKEGGVLQWYGTATDIHEVKQAQEDLAYQKGLLETVTRNTSGALFMLDSANCVVYQNEAAARLTGYTLEELRGKNLHQHIHHSRPDGSRYPPEECPLATALQAHQHAAGEEVFVRKDGTFFPVYYAASPLVVEGAPMGMVIEVRDISDEKKVQQALQESEERLRVATAAADIGTWTYDLLQDKVYASDQYKRLFGLSPHREMTYELFLQAVVEEDRQLTDRVNRAVIGMEAGQTDYEWEYRVRGIEDGQLRWLKARGKVYPGPDGRPQRFAGAVMDITREKEAQINLNYRKALLEAQNNAIPDGLLVVDTRGRILSANRRFAEVWGMPAAIIETGDDGAALRFAMSQVPDPQAFIDRVNYLYHNTREAASEEIFLKNGRILERYGNAVLDEEGTFYGWAWYFRDITRQKAAEGALRQSEEKFRLLADFMPQIVWTAHPDGFVDYFNRRWYEFTGTPEAGDEGSWLSVLHPDDVQPCLKAWYHSVQTGEPYAIEYRFREAATGHYRWHLGKAVAVHDADGRIVKWFGASTDIDDQKRFSERLEALVRQRTGELQSSNQDLQQFAHVASHDLKEPLRKIRTFASRLHDDSDTRLSERGEMYLSKVERAAERMWNMIEGVLAYSSVSSSREAPQPVDLGEVVKEVAVDLEILIQQKDAVLTAAPLPVVMGAPVLIHQLFYNLVNNSLKFVRLGVPPRIDISSEIVTGKEGAVARIVVKDSGIGFSAEHADRIFDTFTRLNPKDQFEGTGLGLSLCKKIVERHGGTITAQGVEGEGASFIITLPLHRGE